MQAFFQRWWGDQSEIIQGLVRKFISSGQLELMYQCQITSKTLFHSIGCLKKPFPNGFKLPKFSFFLLFDWVFIWAWLWNAEMGVCVCMMRPPRITSTWSIRQLLGTGLSRMNSISPPELAGKSTPLAILQFRPTCWGQRSDLKNKLLIFLPTQINQNLFKHSHFRLGLTPFSLHESTTKIELSERMRRASRLSGRGPGLLAPPHR